MMCIREQLQILIDNLVFSKAYEAPERKDAADPFNFLLDGYLRHYKGNAEKVILRSREQFPTLTHSEAQQQWQLVTEAYACAVARQYDVRDGLLTSDQARSQIQTHLPKIDAVNLRFLLAETFAGVYR